MKFCTCEILLGGDIQHTVVKTDVSVPEVAILKKIHGPHAVRGIKEYATKNPIQSDEKDRLIAAYGEKAFLDTFGTVTAKLPIVWEDIDIKGVEVCEGDQTPAEPPVDQPTPNPKKK